MFCYRFHAFNTCLGVFRERRPSNPYIGRCMLAFMLFLWSSRRGPLVAMRAGVSLAQVLSGFFLAWCETNQVLGLMLFVGCQVD